MARAVQRVVFEKNSEKKDEIKLLNIELKKIGNSVLVIWNATSGFSTGLPQCGLQSNM